MFPFATDIWLIVFIQLETPVDYSRYNFVWGASENNLPTLKANNSLLVTSKYIPWNRLVVPNPPLLKIRT